MKTALIEYVLSDSAPVDEVESHIREFVAAIRALESGIMYASHRKRDVERGYVHVARFCDDAALHKLQSAAFFKRFSEYLPAQCSVQPRVTWLDTVASTDAPP